jgi:hypothetical protein
MLGRVRALRLCPFMYHWLPSFLQISVTHLAGILHLIAVNIITPVETATPTVTISNVP